MDTEQNPLLTKVHLADPLTDKDEDVEVYLLLGSDYYYEFIGTERITLQNGIILLNSQLGYIVAGRLEGRPQNTTQLLLTRSQCPDTNFDLERLWKLEEVGIIEKEDTEDDESALTMFNNTVSFSESEKRYYVKWPLKEDNPELPTNFKLAYRRLKFLSKKLQANPALLKQYCDVITQQQSKDMIEQAMPTTNNGLVHYIPHHGVSTPHKATTKLRIVYDASSKITKQSMSLNDCMYRGPVMLHDLCGLMIRFRTNPIAVVCDVEKAFLQIGLQEPDRDLVRFLWLKDPSKPISPANLLFYRFRRVCFGVVASPFLLAGVVSHHLQNQKTPTASKILDNIYVDNIVSGERSTAEAAKYYKDAKQLFSGASMNLREWYSNSPGFIRQIPVADRGEGTTTKILGMSWDVTRDTLSLTAESVNCVSPKTITKRIVLRCVAKMFDPCGLFAPVTITAKFLLQELWQRKYAWDDPLPDDVAVKFKEQVSESSKIPQLKVPRLAATPLGLKSAQVELHCFCDASIKAYSAALYLKITTEAGSTSNLVFAKARISPVKTQSVPRLELTAIFVGTKLAAFLEKELKLFINRKVIWTDSQCVLHWILGRPVATRFVKNRVSAIKQHVGLEFRHVPTKANPADLPTRGTTYQHLATSHLWWKGPPWLVEDDDNWPEMPELLDQSTFTSHWQHFDDQEQIVTEASTRTKVTHLWLTAEESQQAVIFLLREAQARHAKALDKRYNRSITTLGLHSDASGIIRCSTRIQNSDLPASAKEPILLPSSDHLTDLIIQDCHEKLLHAGLKHTLAELRYRYWVVRGRSAVRRVLNQCLLCKRQRGKPYTAPAEPALPVFRVKPTRAFATIGIDYVGPLIIYPPNSTSHKAWLCLFTCAVSRAIHLEVITSMTTDSFLLALRRFVASWGTPAAIVTDNAKQFIAAKDTIMQLWQQMLRSKSIQTFAAESGIKWHFIVELDPWMGGFYEIMVGIANASLKSAINRRRLNLDELRTVTCEVVAVVNSSPLVYCEDELGDHPITPST